MKITQHGKYYDKVAKFECKRCGCKFETSYDDDILETCITTYSSIGGYSAIVCRCPECRRKCQELES